MHILLQNDEYYEMLEEDNFNPSSYELEECSNGNCINKLITMSQITIQNEHTAKTAQANKAELEKWNATSQAGFLQNRN